MQTHIADNLERVDFEIVEILKSFQTEELGQRTDVEPFRAKEIMKEVYDNPVYFATKTFRKHNLRLSGPNNSSLSSERFQEISDNFAICIMTICSMRITYAKMLAMTPGSKKTLGAFELDKLNSDITEMASLFSELNSLNISPNTRYQINEQLNILKGVEKSLNPSAGCYIATHVYGDYNSSEVILLRQFRDNHLNKTIIGRVFISSYYKSSPWLVENFSKNNSFNSIAKLALDSIVKRLRNN